MRTFSKSDIEEYFSYDQDTGLFTCLKKPSKQAKTKIGEIVGKVDRTGHNRIHFRGHPYNASELAYLYMENNWPDNLIVHKNKIMNDDRWCNLVKQTTINHLPCTYDNLRKWFTYNPTTGLFTRNITTSIWGIEGTIAGGTNAEGYILIIAGNNSYLAHRLAYLYMTGKWPKNLIDHIDRVRHNNIWSNLRDSSKSENACNSVKRIDNSSDIKGITWNKLRNKWLVQLSKDGKKILSRNYALKEDAIIALREARERIHGEFSHHG